MTAAAPIRRYLNAKAAGRFSQIPEWLETSSRVSAYAKLIYGRLIRYASDKDGRGWIAFPGKEELCLAVGLINDEGVPQIRKLFDYTSELEEFGLIESVRAGFGRTNFYRFPIHPLMYGEGEDATTERPPEPSPDAERAESDRETVPDHDRRTGPDLDRRTVPDHDRRTGPDVIGERVPIIKNRTIEQIQRTEPSSSRAGGAPAARGRWEGHSKSGEARKVMAFVAWYAQTPDLKHPGNILERLDEGERALDLMIVFWFFCSFADKANQNATVPFSERNYGKLFDQAWTEIKRGLDAWWDEAARRGLAGDRAAEFVRTFGRVSPEGVPLQLVHFAQHGCAPADTRQAVAS